MQNADTHARTKPYREATAENMTHTSMRMLSGERGARADYVMTSLAM